MATERTYDREFCFYHREFCFYQGVSPHVREAWSGQVGEGQVVLEIRDDRILLAGKYGRFGFVGEESLGRRSWNPKPQWILMDVPLCETSLDPFEEIREWPIDWEARYGRPYKSYHHHDEQRGIEWWATYYFDMRPLIYGRVDAVGLPTLSPTDRQLLSLEFDWDPWGRGGLRRLAQVVEHEGWVSAGDYVYAVFDDYGRIDYLWPVQEINRQTRGQPPAS